MIDEFTRECIAIRIGRRLRSTDVIDVLSDLFIFRGAPGHVRSDNGPEFVSKALDRGAYENGVTLDFSRPCKQTDNVFVESFNGTFRAECLDAHWFLSLDDARAKIEAWRRDYNESRPHTSLGWLKPNEFTSLAGFDPAQ